MHIINLSAGMTREDGQAVPAGQYLVDDLNAAEMLVAAERGTASVYHFSDVNLRQLEDPEGLPRRILVVHPGGYGDQMMLGPALRAHKRAHPDVDIHVCCRERHRTVYERLPYPEAFVDYPLNIKDIERRYYKIVLTENMNEASGLGRTMHASDIKAKLMGVDLQGDGRVELALTEEERAFAVEKYPRQVYDGRIEKVKRKRVGIQLAASSYNRTMSPTKMSSIIHSLYMEEWEILIFGTPGSTARLFKEVRPDILVEVRKRVHDLAEAGFTFRQSAAAADTCDAIIAPDSAMMHVAGALGIPCVALFGPIDYKLRTAYYPSVFALHSLYDPTHVGAEGCPIAPCFFHPRGGIMFPKDGPCAQSLRCNAIDSIKISDVGRKLNQLAR